VLQHKREAVQCKRFPLNRRRLLFVHPQSWNDHLMWSAMLLFILTRGPGAISLDCLIARRFLPRSAGK